MNNKSSVNILYRMTDLIDFIIREIVAQLFDCRFYAHIHPWVRE